MFFPAGWSFKPVFTREDKVTEPPSGPGPGPDESDESDDCPSRLDDLAIAPKDRTHINGCIVEEEPPLKYRKVGVEEGDSFKTPTKVRRVKRKLLTVKKGSPEAQKSMDNIMADVNKKFKEDDCLADRLGYVLQLERDSGVSLPNDLIMQTLKAKKAWYYRVLNRLEEGIEIMRRRGRPKTVNSYVENIIIEKAYSYHNTHEVWLTTAEFLHMARKVVSNYQGGDACEKINGDWLQKFLKRYNHKKLVRRVATMIEKKRSYATSFSTINEFMNIYAAMVEDYERKGLNGLIANIDESVLSMDHSSRKVYLIGVKGSDKPFIWPADTTTCLNLTIVSCIAADGSHAQHGLCYGNTNEPADIKPSKFLDHNFYLCRGTEKGYQNAQTFIEYLEGPVNTFFAAKRKQCNSRTIPIGDDYPCILLMDGLGIHETPEVLKAAAALNIKLFKFPAHCTHVLQPLDLTVLKIFKGEFFKLHGIYATELEERLAKIDCEPELKELLKSDAAKQRHIAVHCAHRAMELACIGTYVETSFRRSGLVPFKKRKPLISMFIHKRQEFVFENLAKSALEGQRYAPHYFIVNRQRADRRTPIIKMGWINHPNAIKLIEDDKLKKNQDTIIGRAKVRQIRGEAIRNNALIRSAQSLDELRIARQQHMYNFFLMEYQKEFGSFASRGYFDRYKTAYPARAAAFEGEINSDKLSFNPQNLGISAENENLQQKLIQNEAKLAELTQENLRLKQDLAQSAVNYGTVYNQYTTLHQQYQNQSFQLARYQQQSVQPVGRPRQVARPRQTPIKQQNPYAKVYLSR